MIKWLESEGKTIAGAPLAGRIKRKFPVYLPPQYDSKRKEPYPVIFLLSGWGGRSQKYLVGKEDSAFETPTYEYLDQMISSKEMPEAIVVAPDGTTRFGCSQYINSPANGNFMDYICDEIVEQIDSNFNTHKSPDHRGIMGHSSGGFGALVIAMKRSDRFRAVLSSAADSYFELSIIPEVLPTLIELEKMKGVDSFLKKFFESPEPLSTGRRKVSTMLMLCLASCYAPNLKNPPAFGDLFFDLRSGEINQEVWQKYLAWDPIRLVDQHLDPLKQQRFIRFECGLEDEYALQLGHRQMAQKLTDAGISYELEEYSGGHGGHNWRFAKRIGRMAKSLILN